MNCWDCGAILPYTDPPTVYSCHRPFCVFWTGPGVLCEEKHCKILWRIDYMNGKCPNCAASLIQNSQNGQTVYTCVNKDCKHYNPVFLMDQNTGKHLPFEYDPSEPKESK